ncbi:MAG: UDP-N-acetylmuramoyl-tripeptide--D-alanyl-D-alanine ligase [Armatimonadota bacterium]
MEALSIDEVVAATGGTMVCGNLDCKVTGICTDTRSISTGDLFFALQGENSDGHRFIRAAIESGACGAVNSDRNAIPANVDGAFILVPDTLIALGDLAAYYRSKFDVKVIGITGSVGKTMTREMTASILEQKLSVLKNEMNYNNEIGVPLALFKLESKHQAVVVEMAMRGIGEIRRLAQIAKPSIGVITNIGMSHIERLGSKDAIAQAKAELLAELPSDGIAVLNVDDDFYSMLRNKFSGKVISFGLSNEADITALDAESDENGFYSFRLTTPDGEIKVKLPVMGQHSMLNALAASASAYAMGVDMESMRDGLESFTQPSMRMEFTVTQGGYGVLNDCYNASPASVSAAIQTLNAICGYTRKIAVLGDMLELGDFAGKAHHDIGTALKNNGVDILVAVGELSEEIANGAIQSGFSVDAVYRCADSEDAALLLGDMISPGDAVLVKGSRGMKMEKIVRILLDD